MEAHPAKSVNILAARRAEQKIYFFLKKNFIGAMSFVKPESSKKNN